MKHVFIIAATTLGLASITSPAWADDVTQIRQYGVANDTVIEQIASNGNNVAQVSQGDYWRPSNESRVQLRQQNVDGALAEIYQSGSNNQYNVVQHDGSDLQVLINVEQPYYDGISENSTVLIDQSGFGVRAKVEQTGIYQRAEIVQQGWGGGNLAEINQSGAGQLATIFQNGSGQSATIIQSGNSYSVGNTAMIRQGY